MSNKDEVEAKIMDFIVSTEDLYGKAIKIINSDEKKL